MEGTERTREMKARRHSHCPDYPDWLLFVSICINLNLKYKI